MTFDIETLKLVAAILGLVISTATVQFTIARFVNEIRDHMVKSKPSGFEKFSDFHDLFWAYVVGISFNFLFLVLAKLVREQTAGSEFDYIGEIVFVVFLLNCVLWITGSLVDFLRVTRATRQ